MCHLKLLPEGYLNLFWKTRILCDLWLFRRQKNHPVSILIHEKKEKKKDFGCQSERSFKCPNKHNHSMLLYYDANFKTEDGITESENQSGYILKTEL